MQKTKIRSTLIAASLTSYGIGNILINIITLFIRSGNGIVIFTAVLITLGFFPVFFGVIRSPRFLYKQGKVSELGSALVSISQKNKTDYHKEDFFEEIIGEEIDNQFSEIEGCKIRAKIYKTDQKDSSLIKKELRKFAKLFTNFK